VHAGLRCCNCARDIASTITSPRIENDRSLITQNADAALELSRRFIKTPKLRAKVTIHEQSAHLSPDYAKGRSSFATPAPKL